MTAYYNEHDPFAAAWLRVLIYQGRIAYGIVDERSIEDIRPADLDGFTQHHFFAGIGVWSYALRQAGWPDDRPVWTGSCPCQPFSAAGKGNGFTDERHLWPHWFHLISQHQPRTIFGEQVASKAADDWIDLVQTDLEALDYAFAPVAFPSAGVGAPMLRDRTYWVGDAQREGLDKQQCIRGTPRETTITETREAAERTGTSAGRMADTKSERRNGGEGTTEQAGRPCVETDSADSRLADADHNGRGAGSETPTTTGHRGTVRAAHSHDRHEQPGPTNGFWRDSDWLYCRDGKWRPVRPSTSPLVDGTPARVGRLRGYGNAINAEAAKAFIESYLSI